MKTDLDRERDEDTAPCDGHADRLGWGEGGRQTGMGRGMNWDGERGEDTAPCDGHADRLGWGEGLRQTGMERGVKTQLHVTDTQTDWDGEREADRLGWGEG